MRELEFEQRLRALYRNEVEATGPVPAELRESVLAIPDDVMDRAGLSGPRRRAVLLAAAMLTALLVGGAIALGSGLLRLPWLPEDRITTDRITTIAFWYSVQTGKGCSQPDCPGTETIPVACDQTLPDGLLLSVEPPQVELQVELWKFDHYGPRLYLYDDGLLLRRDLRQDPVRWSQRHLSPDGVQLILAAVEGSGLRDCVGVPAFWPEVEVKARTGDGVVAIGLGSGGLRIVTPAELTAAADLTDRLDRMDLGVPLGGWIEPAWQPYAPDGWEIRISRPRQGDPGGSYQEGPWADLVLPDGSTFLTFGSSVPVPGAETAEYRCRVVGREEAETMTAFLGEPVAFEPMTNEGTWQFWDRSRRERVDVLVSPLPRHEPGCGYDGAPPPDAPRTDLIDDLHVCDYLPETTLTWYRPEEHADFGGGWAACSYPTGGWVFASRHKVSNAAALDLVETLFGVDFTTDEIAGRRVYFNACVEGYCSPAVAISAEPHFVIVVPSEAVTSNLQQLAESLLQRLDDRTEPR